MVSRLKIDWSCYRHTLELLEESYLQANARGDLAGGSGSSGGLERWEKKRRVLATAFDHDGTWLDVGCANGLLMETLTRWTAEDRLKIEPYGLDLSERIAEAARIHAKVAGDDGLRVILQKGRPTLIAARCAG